MEIDLSIKAEQPIPQRMYSDVMAIREQRFFTTLVEPLGLVLTTHVERETTEELGLALQGQVNVVRSRGFAPFVVYLDPQPALKALQHQITGVEIDVSGAGDHLDKIDGKIRRLKELYRSVHAGLPWRLPRSAVKDLVYYCTSRMNLRRSSSNVSTISPRVAFTGRKPNYKKELGLAFGDYVECYDPKVKSNDAEDDRAEPCIALYPTVINAVNAMADQQDGIRAAPTVADAAVQSEDAVDDVPQCIIGTDF